MRGGLKSKGTVNNRLVHKDTCEKMGKTTLDGSWFCVTTGKYECREPRCTCGAVVQVGQTSRGLKAAAMPCRKGDWMTKF